VGEGVGEGGEGVLYVAVECGILCGNRTEAGKGSLYVREQLAQIKLKNTGGGNTILI